MALTPGTRLGPYDIAALLGVGGMGEVYRATDTNLKRQVAIKVLPEAVAGDRERLARLQREAEVLARLDHPNIARIHGLERNHGTTALVMELVEGPTLADRIARGAVPFDEALPIAREIAEALECAHEQGIVHRDLKPSNVKLTPSHHVKLLDFGLAKRMDTAVADDQVTRTSATGITQAGTLVGTAAYMSPEQARGLPVDARTDIWAFGCVLYELLTGTRAIPGTTVPDVLAALLDREPDWTALPAATPPAVRALLQRCLKKDPRERLHHIADARFAIEEVLAPLTSDRATPPAVSASGRGRWIASAAAGVALLVAAITVGWFGRQAGPGGITDVAVAPRGMSVAVLAFANMSGNPENEYLGDGLAEEIINVIARSGVRVVARTSAFSFKGKHTDVREIGRQLGVGTIVEGSVRQSGGRLRVTAQLIRADDGSHLWSETFDRPSGDLFAIQDEIAGAVLRRVAGGAAPPVTMSREAPDPQAYEFYLRGRHEGRSWGRDGLERAERLFEQAVARDPAFGDAWGALSDTVVLRYELHQVRRQDEAYPKARAAAERSLNTSPPSADGYAALAHMHWHQGDWKAAEGEARRALALNPASATGREMLGFSLATLGRLVEAEAEYREAVALDPLTAAYHYNLSTVLHGLGRFEEALASLDRDVALAGTYRNPNVLRRVVDCLVGLGRVDEADRRLQGLGDEAPALAGLKDAFRARTLAARGREREAREVLASLTSTTRILDGAQDNARALIVAWAFASAGDTQASVEWMGRADPDRRREGLALFRYTPEIRRISDHPRMQAFFAEAGLRGLPGTGSGTPAPR